LGALSPGLKRPVYEAGHSPPFRTEVKNSWRYTSTHPYVIMAWCLGKHRETVDVIDFKVNLFTLPSSHVVDQR
jgi:hypothetical protein